MAEPAREAVTSPETIHVASRRFGTYDVPGDRVLTLPDGLVGLPDARRFALLEPTSPGAPFRFMICLDQPDLGFVVCDPESFAPGYRERLPKAAGATGADVAVLALVTVPENPREMTANLMAPLVVDCGTREGRQFVFDAPDLSTRHPLLPPVTPAAAPNE
jgi:flagellar assembly factor FliW